MSINPLMELASAKRIASLPSDAKMALDELLGELSDHAEGDAAMNDNVALRVASYYLQIAYVDSGFEPRLIASRRRSPQLDDTRRRLAVALRAAGLSLRQIGWTLGGRHHTTVLRMLRRSRQ